MSIEGDVVWAAATTWQRDEATGNPHDKNWWYSPTDSDGVGNLLADLKNQGDFRWLVKNGELVGGYDDGELVSIRTVRRLLDEQWSACEKRCNQAAQKERDDIVAWLIEHTEFGANWAAALERGEYVNNV